MLDSVARSARQPWQPYMLPRLRDSSQRSMFDLAKRGGGGGGGADTRSVRKLCSRVEAKSPVAAPLKVSAKVLPCKTAPAPPAMPAPQPSAAQEIYPVSHAHVVDTNQAGDFVRCTRTDPDFVRSYFKASRLHHIGASKARYQKYVADRCVRPRHPAVPTAAGGSWRRTIVHIDMDCFFASVAMRSRPELRADVSATANPHWMWFWH